MTTKTDDTSKPRSTIISWRKRATFEVGKTKHQRKEQHRQQVNALMMVIMVAAVAGGLFCYFNWQSAGSVKAVNCINYPQYCVPFEGGAVAKAGDEFAAQITQNEAEGARVLESRSKGADGVVRGFTTDENMANMPFIGDPDAPIHFAVVSNFTCPHCQTFHTSDLKRFIKNAVLDGQATLRLVLLTGSSQDTARGVQAAYCAGEQGAFWEMSDEMYRLAHSMSASSAFSLGQIRSSASKMKLDDVLLAECIVSDRYLDELGTAETFSLLNGITGTPTMLVSYGDADADPSTPWEWEIVNRDYNNLKDLTNKANNIP